MEIKAQLLLTKIYVFQCYVMHVCVLFFVRGKVYGCFDAEKMVIKNSQESRGFIKKTLKYDTDSESKLVCKRYIKP